MSHIKLNQFKLKNNFDFLKKFQPFCDGSHKKVNSTLNESALKYMPVRFKCIAPGEVYLCMCKSTKKGPFCDGTHKSIKPKEVQ